MQHEGINPTGGQELNLYYLFVSVKTWFRYLLKKWWLIGLIAILAGAAGIYYAFIDKPSYEARLTFALQDKGGGLSGALSLASEFGLNIGGGTDDVFSGDNILEILKSRRIIDRVMLSTDSAGTPQTMADEYLQVQDLKKSLLKNPRLAGISFPVNSDRENLSYLQDSVLFNIYKGIATHDLSVRKPDKKLGIYEITFISRNERFSKVFTEMLTRQAMAYYLELKSKSAKETLDVLEQRAGALKSSMNYAISSKAALQDANVNPAYAQAQASLQKKQADITVYGGAYGELFKNLELARYNYLSTKPVMEILDKPYYPLKKIKLGRLYTGLIFSFVATILLCLFLMARRIILLAGERNKKLQVISEPPVS